MLPKKKICTSLTKKMHFLVNFIFTHISILFILYKFYFIYLYVKIKKDEMVKKRLIFSIMVIIYYHKVSTCTSLYYHILYLW